MQAQVQTCAAACPRPDSSSIEKEGRASLWSFRSSFLFSLISFQLIYLLLHLHADSPLAPRLMSQLHFAFACKGYTATTATATTYYYY